MTLKQSYQIVASDFAEVFEPFLRSYLEKYQYQTVTTAEWKEYLEEYFHDKVKCSHFHVEDEKENKEEMEMEAKKRRKRLFSSFHLSNHTFWKSF